MSPIEMNKLGDRLAAIATIGDFLKGIDTAKINDLVAQLTAFLRMILGLFGAAPAPQTAFSSTEESRAVLEIFSAEQIEANAIDLTAIMALVQLLMQLIALFRKPAANSA